MHHPPTALRRPLGRTLIVVLAVTIALLGVALAAPRADAADRGTGFGTWAPLSSTGWHGSMRVGDLHTYCIHPGLPAPTGPTTDHGVSTTANGLSPQQLVSINHLVSTYGQTDDPVQAAAVGWAVKAIADRETTLHSWGYEGDSLAEAIDVILRRVTPEHNVAIQQRTEQYLAEAVAIPVPRVGGSVTVSTDPADPALGTVVVDADPTAVGSLSLVNAVFADTGSARRDDARAGVAYPIRAPRPDDDGRPYSVRVEGTFAVRAAAVRHFTTPGQQETAGPAGPTTFAVTGQDAAPRPVRFAPRISTEARIDDGDRFVDAVTFRVDDGVWPRRTDGSFVPIRATADIYRTGAYPAESDEIPSRLVPVARLELTTDPSSGAGTYTATTPTALPGPGVYTAVWRIDRSAQDAAVAAHLAPGYTWRERFGSPTQTEQLAPPPPTAPTPPPTPLATPTPVAAPAAPPAEPPAAAALAVTGSSAAPLAVTGVVGATALALGLGAVVLARRRRLRL